MTQEDDKLYSKQLSFSFIAVDSKLEPKNVEPTGVVQNFMNREALSIRREAIERVRRDGIFPLYVRRK
ncbi:hypothetical protein [Roseovarius mucosus]|uniref:hypothetical protein n=1 Tax=Roseovarius mucosus TaxID=215743 RepID=UPI001C5D800D|nr:hypothetical protein [Roseovarius mucosus]